ncbi:MAG: T9SS type A sorting domain-containing protein, partial [Lentimicrobium sp.]|nr:T9SS type A sorting domain-containing protein [Lentimicrobium sp.]
SPNPAKNLALLQFHASGNSPAALQIIDITGRLVFEQSLTTAGANRQTVSIDLQQMKNGIYLVKVNTGAKILTGKILIQK